MLDIAYIKINGQKHGCITDDKPIISFGLSSEKEGEALEKATIKVGDWCLETADQLNNIYDGKLEPHRSYSVALEAKGVSGAIARRETTFRTGRLNTPWKGQWISKNSYDYPKKKSPQPMYFRRRFQAKREIRAAWIESTAFGVYELMLNGVKVGEDYFAPGFTSYQHQLQYQTYDIRTQILENNEITAVVAGGWAAGSFNYIRKSKIYVDRQAFLCEIHLEYVDGTSEIIGTDTSWMVSLDGNYREAEWYDGETYVATIDLDDIQWHQADVTKPRCEPKLIAQYGYPVRVQEKIRPELHSIAPSGEIIYDFGQNFAGVISVKLKAKRNQKVVFRHGEVVVDRELFVKSLRTAKATATYICKDGEQEYSPRLTYMGFRYVGVSGISSEDIELSDLVLHSDFEETGSFECSNPMINQLQSNIRWGGKSNFMDIPTDCPQRDERQGWTGDIAVFASTACFNFDMSRFFDKWLLDMRSEQARTGGIPMVVPRAGDNWPVLATSCWGDSCILVPWAEYLARGNSELLRKQYPAMKKFLKAAKWWSGLMAFTPTSRHIWHFPFHFGDWCAPDESARDWMKKGKWVATAYFANSCQLVSRIASILGEDEDARYYLDLGKMINQSYNNAFTDGKGNLKKEFQTAYVLPLHFQMTNAPEGKQMAKNLVRLVKESGNHLTTGFTGTPYLLFALSDNGYIDEAYDLLLEEECPSWLYEVNAGATTIWERWDSLRPDGTVNIGDLSGGGSDDDSKGGMVSFNHYANGAVGDWLYKRMAGMEPTSGGYKTFKIQPLIGGGISYAKAHYMSPYGKIVSAWKKVGGVFTLDVEVPVSTEATVMLPDGKMVTAGSGKYRFECSIQK